MKQKQRIDYMGDFLKYTALTLLNLFLLPI